ncbi:MAG: energy-coupling factor ABC transporter permease [Methanomicrobiales archaeon]|nr:energy-coupling factor ABC transporter permease [Methanomicrobiales archaeon]
MAHIHLQDGAFSLPFTLLWWAVALILLGACLYRLRTAGRLSGRQITTAALCTAAAFAVFQVSLPLFGGIHLTLTPLVGILAGPVTGCVIVFLVNILSAATGHGGWGLVGANTLVSLAEVTVAALLFAGLRRMDATPGVRAGIATLVALAAGNAAMIGIILVSGIQGVTQTAFSLLAGLSLIALVNMGAAVIESLVTALMISYIARVGPVLLGEKEP